MASAVIFAAVSFKLIYSYPSWYIALCLIIALIYTAVLYFRSSGSVARWLKMALASLRFIAVSIILLLLLNPLLKYTHSVTEKPVVLIGLDNSNSIVRNSDSAYYKGEFKDAFEQASAKLAEKFNVVTYSLGEEVTKGSEFSYNGSQTDLNEFIRMTQEAYQGQNVGAVVLASDGIFNKGLNPVYSNKQQKVPVYTVKMGDTSVRKDALISSIRSNKIAYLNNRFPVVADVLVKKAQGSKLEIRVIKSGQVLARESFNVTQNSFSKTFRFQLEASTPGLQQYIVQVDAVSGERHLANNTRSFYVDVLDSRQKILLCASAPHPDIGAIKRSIEGNENYELDVKIDQLPSTAELKNYSLVILHQYPSSANEINPVSNIVQQKVPTLFVLGAQTNMGAYGRLNLPMKVNGARGSLNQSAASLNSDFLLFELDEDLKNRFNEFPPLFTPFGNYSVPIVSNSLFYQKIGVVNTSYPLIYLHNEEGYRSGYIAGEGWWKWAMAEYRKEGDFNATDELLSKLVQYLSVKKDQRKLRVNSRKRSYSESENIVLEGELYNDNFELMNTPELSVDVQSSSGKNYPFVFGKQSNRYRAELGKLPADQYSYTAKTVISGKPVTSAGIFVVRKMELELVNLEANHKLLNRMSELTAGKSFESDQWSALADDLLANSDLVPVRYSTNSFKELLHQKWLVFLIIGLLSLEWLVRKWNSI